MKNYKLGVVAVMLTLLLSACAGTPGKTAWYDTWGNCAAAGAAAGIAAGATDDFDSAMAAGVGGFLIGGAICAFADTDADVSARLIAAGGVAMGKLSTHEFALGAETGINYLGT